jgi:hypothetical protein
LDQSTQLTPYWDWSDYYHRDCLVDNTFSSTDDSFLQPDCSVKTLARAKLLELSFKNTQIVAKGL